MLARFNKALVPLVLAGWAVSQSWIETRHFSLSQEFVMAVLGVVAALIVYLVPNVMAPGLAGVRKAVAAAAVAVAAVVVQWVATKHLSATQELITALQGVGTAVFVFWVPNLLRNGPPAA